jgi:hypothetical protein
MPGVTALRRKTPGYGVVLMLLGGLAAIGAALPSPFAALVSAVLSASLWVAVGRVAALGRRALRVGVVAVGILVTLGAVGAALDRDGLLALVELANAAAVAAVVVVIARDLMREHVVTIHTVVGVLSLYLMIGLFYASLYQAADLLDPDAFSAAFDLDRFRLVYFSFITLATVGYGDITPSIDGVRALAMTEAVVGQLFLVTVVARVVSLFAGRRRAAGD